MRRDRQDQRLRRLRGRDTDSLHPSAPSAVKGIRRGAAVIMEGLPVSFEKNEDQAEPSALYVGRIGSQSVFVETDRVRLKIYTVNSPQRHKGHKGVRDLGAFVVNETSEVVLRFLNSNPDAKLTAEDPLPGKSNYLFGNDPSHWKTNVPQYARIRYKQIYPGIDLVFYGHNQQLEYDLVVSPGADPNVVKMEFVENSAGERESGRAGELRSKIGNRKSKLQISDEGDLILATPAGEIRQLKPKIYQEVNGFKFPVPGRYVLSTTEIQRAIGNPQSAIRNSLDIRHSSLVTFQIDSYDRTKPLVIDPKVVTPIDIPGSGNQQIQGIAADAQGNWYLTGSTDSTNFATRNPVQSTRAGDFDAFVMKLSPDGKTILYSTYLGGTKPDTGYGVAVDSAGSAYVVGMTDSTDFPTRNPIQSAYAGPANPFTFAGDSFVAKLSPEGSSLVYSTYLGGSQDETRPGIAVDSSGNVYVAGGTSSTNFPTRNALQSTMTPAGATGTFFQAGFISKLNASGSALVYSTFLGGGTRINGMAIDSTGNVYVMGNAGTIPSPSGFQRTPGGGGDAFVVKVNSAGSAVVYSTYLGGSGLEQGWAIAVDASGNAHVTGSTQSTNFPTVNPFQPSNGGNGDTFVTKLNPAGTALVYSSYLGGSQADDGKGIALDTTGRATVAGTTRSTNFPVKDATQTTLGGGSDIFVIRLSTAGSLEFSTYIGRTANEYTNAVAVGSTSAKKTGGDGIRYVDEPASPT
ncbi:MAG TPA: SBBP repeat-containing protein [Acidobacteriota bacterium]|jgi:hypothetical protein